MHIEPLPELKPPLLLVTLCPVHARLPLTPERLRAWHEEDLRATGQFLKRKAAAKAKEEVALWMSPTLRSTARTRTRPSTMHLEELEKSTIQGIWWGF